MLTRLAVLVTLGLQQLNAHPALGWFIKDVTVNNARFILLYLMCETWKNPQPVFDWSLGHSEQ